MNVSVTADLFPLERSRVLGAPCPGIDFNRASNRLKSFNNFIDSKYLLGQGLRFYTLYLFFLVNPFIFFKLGFPRPERLNVI